ncbi:conserved hypothetical protein, partial [Ricinus communis]
MKQLRGAARRGSQILTKTAARPFWCNRTMTASQRAGRACRAALAAAFPAFPGLLPLLRAHLVTRFGPCPIPR